jgi:hypothetical protein
VLEELLGVLVAPQAPFVVPGKEERRLGKVFDGVLLLEQSD